MLQQFSPCIYSWNNYYITNYRLARDIPVCRADCDSGFGYICEDIQDWITSVSRRNLVENKISRFTWIYPNKPQAIYIITYFKLSGTFSIVLSDAIGIAGQKKLKSRSI